MTVAAALVLLLLLLHAVRTSQRPKRQNGLMRWLDHRVLLWLRHHVQEGLVKHWVNPPHISCTASPLCCAAQGIPLLQLLRHELLLLLLLVDF